MFAEVKRLNKTTAKRLAIFSVIAAGIAFLTLFVTVSRPKYTQFCARCHGNVLFNNGCKKSSSGDIDCIECHTHENRGVSVLAVEIRDEHCTDESCHPSDKLSAESVQYKKIKPFQHRTHLDGFTGNLKLRCTSCHASSGGERHFETDKTTCNICHFINTQQPFCTKDKKPVSDCALCHGNIEKTMEIYGKTFKHDLYEGNEKVRCSDCHFNTIQGQGRVDKEGCYKCHPKVADNFNNTSEMHYNHVVKHKTGCTPCHASITHGWINREDSICRDARNPQPADVKFMFRNFNVGWVKRSAPNNGLNCFVMGSLRLTHPTSVYNEKAVGFLSFKPQPNFKIQNQIMMGTGGAGIEDEPDPMYLATLNCSACHGDSQHYRNVVPRVCNNCHERGFDKILSEQMRLVASEMRQLKALLAKAKRRYQADTDLIMHKAEANYNLIVEDGSLGAHNIKYIKDLLDYSIVELKQSLQQSAYENDSYLQKQSIPAYPDSSCVDRCHVNYMAYHNVYEEEVFRHKSHSPDQGLACSGCHNNDAVNTETHGNLIIQNNDCKACHHREMNDAACLKCHAAVRDYVDGNIPDMVAKTPDWMSVAVSCTDCHKLESDGYSFKIVRTYCIECHNPDYGLLYDAWKETLESKTNRLYKSDTNAVNMRILSETVQSYGMHNFRLSQMLLKSHD